jgi:hypothetical protein
MTLQSKVRFVNSYRFLIWKGWQDTWHWQVDDGRLATNSVVGGYDLPDEASALAGAAEYVAKRTGTPAKNRVLTN